MKSLAVPSPLLTLSSGATAVLTLLFAIMGMSVPLFYLPAFMSLLCTLLTSIMNSVLIFRSQPEKPVPAHIRLQPTEFEKAATQRMDVEFSLPRKQSVLIFDL